MRRRKPSVEELLTSPEGERAYEEEVLYGRVRECISQLLAKEGLLQQDLARKLGVSDGRVSQLLSSADNITLKTLARIGWALGYRFEVVPEPIGHHEPLSDLLASPDPTGSVVFHPLPEPEPAEIRIAAFRGRVVQPA